MTVPAPRRSTATTTTTISDTSTHQIFTPDFTPSSTPSREQQTIALEKGAKMDGGKPSDSAAADKEQPPKTTQETEVKVESPKEHSKGEPEKKAARRCARHHKACKKCKSKKSKKEQSDSESDSSSSGSSSSSTSSSESEADDSSASESSSSEDERAARRRRKAKKQSKQSKHKSGKRRSKRVDPSSSEDEDSESEASSEEEDVRHSKKRLRKTTKKLSRRVVEETSESQPESDESDEQANTAAQLRALQIKNARLRRGGIRIKTKKPKGKRGKGKASLDKPQYFRGDELWDREIHDYRLTPTSERVDEDDYGEYIFHVRRRFDWEGKYQDTVVDIKSKTLRGCLKHVMATCKLVSLAEETPTLDPNQLFLYLEELRAYRKELKGKLKNEKKKKAKKHLKEQIGQLRCLLKYLDKDYAKTRKTLYPMLEAGNITFDLLWTLFRSDTTCYASTYTAQDEPRAFKVEYATKESSFVKGTWMEIEGRYMDFDGKTFGLGSMDIEIESFKGPRRINSLPCYPLKYHKDTEAIKVKLVARGKKFVELAGMQYKFHKGISFTKRKRQAIKVTTNGRVMIDPATFRRTNPNYPISTVKPPDPGVMNVLDPKADSDSEDGGCCCGGGSDDEDEERAHTFEDNANDEPRKSSRLIFDKTGKPHFVTVEIDEHGMEIKKENMEKIPEGSEKQREFSDEELLIASPVVLGFAFSEKLWLEFTVSGIHDIEWNEGAFESLVLPEKQKSIVKALVQSHTSEAAERKNIDDVIQGKGRGLVAVLHGTPGVGKTLTAESIAELLKCPLYCVSAGELGTNPRELEQELQKILDLAHAWGAVLLLDEADVFLEARTAQDIHRNALVSIFLRLLEYFQGILFLTTNRVATFDDAFQSRIHIALRYQELDFKARRAIFSMFLDRVASLQAQKSATKSTVTIASSTSSTSATSSSSASLPPSSSSQSSDSHPNPPKDPKPTHSFSPEDLDRLARRANLNGRQIKNAVRSAQALAVNAGEPLAIAHLLQVLDVAESFERDLKGGTGYVDAMRSYM